MSYSFQFEVEQTEQILEKGLNFKTIVIFWFGVNSASNSSLPQRVIGSRKAAVASRSSEWATLSGKVAAVRRNLRSAAIDRNAKPNCKSAPTNGNTQINLTWKSFKTQRETVSQRQSIIYFWATAIASLFPPPGRGFSSSRKYIFYLNLRVPLLYPLF